MEVVLEAVLLELLALLAKVAFDRLLAWLRQHVADVPEAAAVSMAS